MVVVDEVNGVEVDKATQKLNTLNVVNPTTIQTYKLQCLVDTKTLRKSWK